eukprot:CAMPEP_0173188410 /NCGR_PEP_ID=MMETSP1141-20130122/11240_1 /TAXON_ID=483371 /ORGANISM="non described non described, Strain CCMP2298" /LENGTH=143 /DNA_ID=CAMNT_0014112337 /DNA_START=357 /DNA_END=788 /DNA_ORIENTATION=-
MREGGESSSCEYLKGAVSGGGGTEKRLPSGVSSSSSSRVLSSAISDDNLNLGRMSMNMVFTGSTKVSWKVSGPYRCSRVSLKRVFRSTWEDMHICVAAESDRYVYQMCLTSVFTTSQDSFLEVQSSGLQIRPWESFSSTSSLS